MVVARGYWSNKEHHLKYAESLKEKYGWASDDDWYNLSQKHFMDTDGNGLLRGTYGGSPQKFLSNIYPDILFLPWKFKNVSQGFWNSPDNVRWFFDWMGEHLGFKKLNDLYDISQEQYCKYGGAGLQRKFNGSRLAILQFAYPSKKWCEWKFKPRISGYFDSLDNLRAAIKDLEEICHIKKHNDWYQYTGNIIDKHFGTGLLANKFGCSFSKLLKTVYPEYDWKLYRFYKAPLCYWNEHSNKVGWLHDFMNHMGFKTYEDLYKTTYEDVCNFYGRGLIDRYDGSYIRAFMDIIPSYIFDEAKFLKGRISRGEKEWLNFLEISRGPIQRQYTVPGTHLSLDGANIGNKMGYQYHGDYWHGHNRFPRDAINPTTKKTFGTLFDETYQKEERLRNLGWSLKIIWEYEWKRSIRSVVYIQRKFRLNHL